MWHAVNAVHDISLYQCCLQLPLDTLVFTLWLSELCVRSKAWLAARVTLAQSSRRLVFTRAAAPGLLAHAEGTQIIICFPMGPKLRYPAAL